MVEPGLIEQVRVILARDLSTPREVYRPSVDQVEAFPPLPWGITLASSRIDHVAPDAYRIVLTFRQPTSRRFIISIDEVGGRFARMLSRPMVRHPGASEAEDVARRLAITIREKLDQRFFDEASGLQI